MGSNSVIIHYLNVLYVSNESKKISTILHSQLVELPYIAGHSLCWKIDYVNDNDDIKNGYSYIVMIIIMSKILIIINVNNVNDDENDDDDDTGRLDLYIMPAML